MRKNEAVGRTKSIGKFLFVLLLSIEIAASHPIYAATKSKKKKIYKKEKKKRPPRSPKKATLMSLVPGMGQAYNHKYWKIPIVYAGFGVIGYFALTNQKEYSKYSDAYTCKIIDPKCTNPISLKYSENTLRTIRDYYRRNTQLSYIVMGAWYLLQMIDANVDAHLSHWDVSDKLSLDVTPMIAPTHNNPANFYKGISLRFNF